MRGKGDDATLSENGLTMQQAAAALQECSAALASYDQNAAAVDGAPRKAMRPITAEEISAENRRQQAANRYENIDPYVEEKGVSYDHLAAIKARIDGEFDHPALKAFGPLSDTMSDIVRIAEEGIRLRWTQTSGSVEQADDEDAESRPRP
ncbi:hypothetical protein CSC66_09025 [Pseudoxanthomonas kaohsiungensis]|nr:hypothetical protein CSC66_09025 [Pseudoxanthomonas kaohsiungensis]